MSSVDWASKIRDAWGPSHFVTSESKHLARLGLSVEDRAVLAHVGLPTGPEWGLELNLRFENVQIHHRPRDIGLLSESKFQRTSHYPLTGDPDTDVWARLDRFVVLGEVPNDNAPESRYYQTRLLCIDASTSRIVWVHPIPMNGGTTMCCPINTSLVAYLASLLAYKQFRSQRPESDEDSGNAGDLEDPGFDALLDRIHTEFLRQLEAADPAGFKDFWESHAWNEHILLHS